MEKKVRTQRCWLRDILVTNWTSQGQVSSEEGEKQDKAKHMEQQTAEQNESKGSKSKRGEKRRSRR